MSITAGTPLPGTGTHAEKPSWWVALLVLPIRFYQRYLSWMLGQNCRYFPSCSSYAAHALIRHGLIKGTMLAVWRLLRCHPWARGGSDRVPPRGRWKPDPYVPPVFDNEFDDLGIDAGEQSPRDGPASGKS